jgi:hypothetical protein
MRFLLDTPENLDFIVSSLADPKKDGKPPITMQIGVI